MRSANKYDGSLSKCQIFCGEKKSHKDWNNKISVSWFAEKKKVEVARKLQKCQLMVTKQKRGQDELKGYSRMWSLLPIFSQ